MSYYLAGSLYTDKKSNEEALERLRSKGFSVFSAYESGETQINAFKKMFDCDAIIVMPGWAMSEQVRGEVFLALTANLPIFAYHHHRPELLEELSNLKIVTRAEMLAK